MKKRYVYFSVIHPRKARQISVDIEIDSIEDDEGGNTYGENGSVLDDIIIPLLNKFTEFGLSSNYVSTGLHDSYRQVDYFGTPDEVIRKILTESI